MSTETRIGIIGGNGWIGGAIARALVSAEVLAASDLTLSSRSDPPEWLPGAHWTRDNQELVDRSDVVILSVRPQHWPALAISVEGKLVVSVMAGVTLSNISVRLGATRVVRALPNAAAEVAKSYTPWTAAAPVTDRDRAVVRRIFMACGTEDEVATEAALDYLTGLSGTGPAYPALLASAMMQDAIAHGIPAIVARRGVVALLIGTGRLFEKGDEDPREVVAAFLNYRGVTAAAIEAMRASGFEAAVSAGLAAALEKSRALGEPG